MEALYGVSLGAMGSLLRKLDELLQTQDRAPNIRKLREDVGIISSKLVKLSEVHDPPLTVNYWTRDARELSYDIEDCVDQFVHADEDAKMVWMDEISGFSTRAEEVRERYDRFELEYVLSRPAVLNTVANHHLGTVDSERKSIVPVGMEGPENEVLRWLEPNGDDEKELQLNVVSILGGVGVGKSTLVQNLWRKLAEESECRAFVHVGKRPDMRMILGSILSQVRPHQPPEVCQVPNLIHDIRKYLQHKRYFVVIDDIWAVSVWDALSRAFSDDYCCSRIITTTAIEDVALACCSYDPVHIFKMKPLSVDHSKELFTSTVFGSGNGCPQQLHDVSDVIIRKCGGLPLAITCIATLVARLPETLQQWEYVQNFLCENLRANSTSDEVLKQVMKLCYSCLPQYLKTCLLYLSVYPENYIFVKEDLVQQWIVEGFICTVEGKDSIEIAQDNFDELISLGLIQQIDINSMKKRLSYAVHPVVFDFITCKSIEDNYITVIDYSQTTIQLTDKVRRLSLHFGSATYATTPASIGLSQVRSLAFMGLLNCMPSLEEFKLVRVVILHFRGDDAETSFPLKEICGLLLLRYLQVRCNVTVELPDQIQCLKRLETLEINARIAAVPSDIFHISSLLHVRLGGKTNPTLAPVLSWKVISLQDSSSASFPPIFLRRVEFLPPICIFSRLPEWIRQLRKLRVLKIVVKRLLLNDISVLRELPALIALSLYVLTPIARHIFFGKTEFRALEYFKFVCSGLSLGFREEAMPNLRRLKIGFNAQRGGEYSYMFAGIHYLLNLKEVEAKIGADNGAEELDRRAAESAFKDAFRMHPRHPNVKVKRVDRVNQEYVSSDKQNWSQPKKSSNERENVQCETQNEEPSVEQPKMLGKMPKHDTTERDSIWISQFSNPPEVHSSIRRKSVVAPRNITFKSFGEVMGGSSKKRKFIAVSSRYAKDADQSGNVYTSELIREIGRELSISCLLRLPRSDYNNLACVSRSFCSLIRSGELYRLRREARIAEDMIYCSCNVLKWDGFDPCRRRWFNIPSMPPIDQCFTLADKESLAVGTNILVFGRRVEAHVVLRYSLITNSWTTGEMMNTPRCLFGSASFGEKAIVAGGIGENGTLSSAELYDSEMQTWTTLPRMNRARQMCSGFFMDGKFYVIGGKAEKHNEILSCAEEFDLENGTWRLIPYMAGGIIDESGAPPLVAVVNNELYAVVDYVLKEVKVRKYDKEYNAWITLGSLPERYTSVHDWGLAFRSCGDMLIVIGGMSVGGSRATEICSWVPNDGQPDWKIIGTRCSGSVLYNCVVMSC